MGVYLDPCIELLKKEFETEEMQKTVNAFLAKASFSSKWLLYSDYCLDDSSKPNDVITFVMLPFISESEYQAMDKRIGETQPTDIKHAKSVDEEFMDFIKQKAVFSFSFIVNDRQRLFGDTEEEQIKTVQQILTNLKDTFATWRNNAEEGAPIDYYKDSVKLFQRQLKEIFQKKDVKNHIDILLISILGAIYSAEILKNLPGIDIFGWFPDRDKTNEACGQMIMPIFNALQYNHIGGKQFQFVSSTPDSTNIPFYDNENRIADVICGTLADYDIENNLVSKDKFTEVLKGLMADNVFMKVYRLFMEKDMAHLGTILISSKPPKDNSDVN